MRRERVRRVTDKLAQVLSTADHDLLIRISEKLEGLQSTCNNLTIALATKAEVSDIVSLKTDHETRIRILENSKSQLVGGLLLAQLGFGVCISLVLHFWK